MDSTSPHSPLNPLWWFPMPLGIKSKLPTWVNMIWLLLNPSTPSCPVPLMTSWQFCVPPTCWAGFCLRPLPSSLNLERSSLRFSSLSERWSLSDIQLLLKCQLCRVNSLIPTEQEQGNLATVTQISNTIPFGPVIPPLQSYPTDAVTCREMIYASSYSLQYLDNKRLQTNSMFINRGQVR